MCECDHGLPQAAGFVTACQGAADSSSAPMLFQLLPNGCANDFWGSCTSLEGTIFGLFSFQFGQTVTGTNFYGLELGAGPPVGAHFGENNTRLDKTRRTSPGSRGRGRNR